jgi:hypothetical protein
MYMRVLYLGTFFKLNHSFCERVNGQEFVKRAVSDNVITSWK